MTDHPITPPTELVEQWYEDINNSSTSWKQELATQAARWGANQQLDQDAKWLDTNALFNRSLTIVPPGDALRQEMRPKPPSLAEQALALVSAIEKSDDPGTSWDFNVIHRALERLQELEGNG